MSRYSIDGQILTDIGDALRIKNSGIAATSVSDVGYVRGSSIEAANGVATEYKFSTPWPRTKITIESVEYLAPEAYEGANYIAVFYYNSAEDSMGSSKNIWGTDTLPVSIIHEHNADYDNLPSFGCYRASEANISYTMIPVDENDEPIDLTIKPEDMASKISNMMALSEADLAMTGDLQYRFSNDGWNWVVQNYGDKITFKDVTNVGYMFYQSAKLVTIPFVINNITSNPSMSQMFNGCRKLTNMPNIMGVKPSQIANFMTYCVSAESFPEGFAEDWDWTFIDGQTSQYQGGMNAMFQHCYSLRNVPTALISHTNPYVSNSYGIYYNGFQYNYNLEKIEGLAVPYSATWSSNAFRYTFDQCERLKDVIFNTQEDGTPFVASGWKNQVIDLTTVGFGSNCKSYNSDLTNDTKVDNMTKWSRLANNSYGGWPNYWTDDVKWSVYGRDSAVRTINSLPDVSGSGSTNTIKFNANGAKSMGITDGSGKSIAELSDAEIAVAAAKGWTVTLA